jgi:Phosphoesterase family
MAHRHSKKHNPVSRKAMVQRRRRAIGVAAGVSAFLALGLGTLTDAPEAHADGFDAVFDQVFNAITASFGDLAGVSGAVPELGGLGVSAADASMAAASPADTWLNVLEQDWTAFGQQVDTALNTWFNHVDSAAVSNVDAQTMSGNLLVNPGFETADPSKSGFSGVTIPGWSETGTPTVIAYGTQGGFPLGLSTPFPKFFDFPQTPPPGGGDNFAGGGPVATSSIFQTVALAGEDGKPFTLSADLGGQGWDNSNATVEVTFFGDHDQMLGTDSLNPVTVWDRWGLTGFEERDISGTVPVGTTYAEVTTKFTDNDAFLGNYNGAYADNESFTVGDPNLTAATLIPPTSNVGQLDHVFLIYLENKGVNDIVGSPNAPYLNQLINSELYDSNYYALGHPSDPNYIRPLGGSDFGIDYNPTGNVIDANSLMQEMDQAGITWAGYAQSMPTPGDLVSSGDYSPDELPFVQFSYVYENSPEYLAHHLLPLTQLSTDLQNPSSFPEFTWIAANEANNGEGPIDSLQGIGQFIYSQLTDHQYNVEAADQFVQQQVSAIENSPTWNDAGEKDAIIITFDEDNNNLSLGIGNEGNNVPMIIIPNGGAVTDGGMQSGPFTTNEYANEYSLMATIEDALRGHALPDTPDPLAPLTDNDMYAQPMNAFWKPITP